REQRARTAYSSSASRIVARAELIELGPAELSVPGQRQNQHRYAGVADHHFGHAAQRQPLEAGAAVRGHRDQIHVVRARILDDLVRRIATSDELDLDVDAGAERGAALLQLLASALSRLRVVRHTQRRSEW